MSAQSVQEFSDAVLCQWERKRCDPNMPMRHIIADAMVNRLRCSDIDSRMELENYQQVGLAATNNIGDWFMTENQTALLEQLQLPVSSTPEIIQAIAEIDTHVLLYVTELIRGMCLTNPLRSTDRTSTPMPSSRYTRVSPHDRIRQIFTHTITIGVRML